VLATRRFRAACRMLPAHATSNEWSLHSAVTPVRIVVDLPCASGVLPHGEQVLGARMRETEQLVKRFGIPVLQIRAYNGLQAACPCTARLVSLPYSFGKIAL
jgi:hypothetical protein